MRELILVAHISLDGFAAGPKGELDGFDAGEENLEFVCKLTEDADTALFGKVSYELLNRDWPSIKDRPDASKAQIAYSNWYSQAKKIVISKSMATEDSGNLIVISNNILSEMNRLKNQPGKNILIFGSPRATQSLMQLDLIDRFWIFVNPVLFGEGIGLFDGVKFKSKLKLVTTKQFPNGEIALNYVVDRQES